MKRPVCISLVVLLIFALCSCESHTKSILVPVTFYYRTTDIEFGTRSGVITSEIREARGHAEEYQYIIEQYLNGPKSSGCISPFPAGTTLEALSLDNNKVYIMLSPHLAILTGSDLMIACACLTKTVLELTGVKSVQISAENRLLNNEESITMTAASFAYWDDSIDFTVHSR